MRRPIRVKSFGSFRDFFFFSGSAKPPLSPPFIRTRMERFSLGVPAENLVRGLFTTGKLNEILAVQDPRRSHCRYWAEIANRMADYSGDRQER
jgi:hypothetical protein